MDSADDAGTELDVLKGGRDSSEEGVALAGVAAPLAGAGGGRAPPERNDGQSERSSGREVPPVFAGDICERMAAACRKQD